MHEDVNVREPVVAWRKWEVSIDDGLLLSLFKDAVWIPGERLEAKCLNSGGQIMSARRTCTRAPSRNCACGIYGVFHKEDTHKFGATKAFPTITCTLSKLTCDRSGQLVGPHSRARARLEGRVRLPVRVARPAASSPRHCRGHEDREGRGSAPRVELPRGRELGLMRGQWVPKHVSISMEPMEAEALRGLLQAVDEDAGFPLNELEMQVVEALMQVLDVDPDSEEESVLSR
jgi:hypothetical protein